MPEEPRTLEEVIEAWTYIAKHSDEAKPPVSKPVLNLIIKTIGYLRQLKKSKE